MFFRSFRTSKDPEIPVGTRLLVRVPTTWDDQVVSPYLRDHGVSRKLQLATSTKTHVLDVETLLTYKQITDDVDLAVPDGIDLSYYIQFLGTDDEVYIADHRLWGVVLAQADVNEQEGEEVDEAKALSDAKNLAIANKRNNVAAFY